MFEMSRDPRYLLPLAILLGVIVVSAVLVERAPRHARAAAHPAATAAAGAPPLDDVLIDSRRALDLARLREALTKYHDDKGVYPATGGKLVTMCATPDDVGCAVAPTAIALPFSDGTQPYFYASDGATYFALVAHAQIASHDRTECLTDLPPDLKDAPLLCVLMQKAAD